MTAHLRGREKALEPFGWTGRRAEWIALACLHGGVFTRAQWTRFLGCHTEKVRRAVHALVAQGVAVDESVPGITGIGRVCRIHGRGIYRALGFTNALRFHLFDERPALVATLAAQEAESLLLWGGTDAEGEPFLNPAFVVDAPPALPGATGGHRITGRTAGGAELFSVEFAMPEVADGDGSSSFAFVLPVQPGWADSLAGITLSGPGGSTTLDSDTDIPMTILLDPSTGQVRGILRDVPQAAAAAALTPQADVPTVSTCSSAAGSPMRRPGVADAAPCRNDRACGTPTAFHLSRQS